MMMNRTDLINLVLAVYAEEIGDDTHYRSLIAHRPVDHLREKGYKVTRIDFGKFEVEKGEQ